MIRTTLVHSARTAPFVPRPAPHLLRNLGWTRGGRRGVTLVEMLVATAMCILGMWMLTWMFQQATASFSLANAQVTLTNQERMVTTILTRDLEANKFPDDDTLPNRGRKVSDLTNGVGPKAGYFLARSSAPGVGGNVLEAGGQADGYGFYTSRSTDHWMQFTNILADTPGNRYYAEVQTSAGPRTFSGTAAEIAYFLVPSVQTPGGMQLYDLMRVQRIVALTDYDAKDYLASAVTPGYAASDLVHEVMVCGGPTAPVPFNVNPPQMYTLANLANAAGPRFGRAARPLASRRYGEDRLMSNVVSFEIKFTGSGTQVVAGAPTAWPTAFSSNTDFPYDTLPATGYQYDTASPVGPDGKPFHITSVQIRIRALSGTTARQTTIVVSL